MASAQHILLSPRSLPTSMNLSVIPPLRPDGRAPNQFRPLVAETGILPGTNGSVRICFADGTEAIVGVKAEVEKTRLRHGTGQQIALGADEGGPEESKSTTNGVRERGESDWVELAVEIPGYRDDDSATVFLSAMLSEALLSGGDLAREAVDQ